MPYIVRPGADDDRSVSKKFAPEIDQDFKRALSGVRPLTEDERLNLPKKLEVGKPRKGGLPHILGWSVGPYIVSGRVRDIIELLEPETHEFSAMRAVSSSDRAELGTYHFLFPPPCLDAVLDSETEWWGGRVGYISSFSKVTLRVAVIAGHHLWRGVPPRMDTKYFCSDELRDRLLAEGLDGWDMSQRCLVRNV